MFRRTLLACLLAGVAVAPAVAADNWPQWRGPANDGLSPDTGVPTEWGPEKNVVWKLQLPGRGSSTPCIWGDKIFLTALDKSARIVLCVGTDGKEKWRHTLGTGTRTSYKGDEGDEASPSCVTDGEHVWAFVGTGTLACLTLDGKPVWDVDIQQYGKFGIQFGIHWTPVLYKDRLYLQVMHRNAQILVALDKATGKEAWKVERKGASKGESPDVYASASVWEGHGGPLLIAHGNDFCTAHKLTDGSEVWRVAGLNPSNNRAWRFVSSPLVTPDLIVVPSCKGGPTVGLNPVGATGTIDPDSSAELWRFKSTPDVVSPLRVGNVVYLMGDGPLTAVDAKTGAQLYRSDLTRQIHRANMVAADGKVYVVGREGVTDVVAAGPAFKLLATNTLPDKFYASPAIAGGRLYLRGWANLWVIGTK